MELSSGFGQAFAAVRWAQGMVAGFVHPSHMIPSTRQELSAMHVSGSDPIASLALMTNETGTIAAATDRSTVDDATAMRSASAESADAGVQGTIALWRAVDLDVSAVIGQRGTAAVLRRALYVTRRTHGWMSEPADDTDFDACVSTLSDALAGQAPEERASGQHALESAFHDLLASLVGAALAAQLLRTAWAERQARIDAVP